MQKSSNFTGKPLHPENNRKVEGRFLEIKGEKYYSIHNYDGMDDFFVSVVSPSDQWMYISSNGSLTAGRKNRDNALFPYYTDDKIHDYHGITGSRTYIIAEKNAQEFLWEPFQKRDQNLYHTEKIIYKNLTGNKIRFQEINHDLGLEFHYEWSNSDRYGFVKSSGIRNLETESLKIRMLDGIGNILPPGASYAFQNEFSNLLDAYKKSELLEESRIGLFTLSSVPVDRPEPSEALLANTVLYLGAGEPVVLLSEKQLNKFLKGKKPETEFDIRASRGFYSIYRELNLPAEKEEEWMLVADVNLDAASVWNLHKQILEEPELIENIQNDIEQNAERLKKIISSSDGLQLTDCTICTSRHSSNTLYNAMRGGIFFENYDVDARDLKNYLRQINPSIANQFEKPLLELPGKLTRTKLFNWAEKINNPDLSRIIYEYLPLGFSRRHGDPSRPWNNFSLPGKNENGSPNYHYEGNWRDIFQNWEALAWSFPGYTESMITRFLNASTADGYNPYRITREGIDWESPDPDSPWAFIGYWGDHQIIYLLKLLELQEHVNPGKLSGLLKKEFFVYTNVPYRIRTYDDILYDPHNTILFDSELSDLLKKNMKSQGADAVLLRKSQSEDIHRVSMMEKILVTLLAKLSNFIPDAGIWLNTQRPEWNDANNALVGKGSSMVTVYYLRRFVHFWLKVLQKTPKSDFPISEEVCSLLNDIKNIFQATEKDLDKGFSPGIRKQFTDGMGKAHEKYRNRIYSSSFSGALKLVNGQDLLDFLTLTQKFIESTIRRNQRKDGLFHSYNLVSFKEKEIHIRHLYEMLEGQVAVLSSGVLNPQESLQLLDALKESQMYREDQYSYMLYPDRELPRFLEKGLVDEKKISESGIQDFLLRNEEAKLFRKGEKGLYFHPSFRNAGVLRSRLDHIMKKYPGKITEEEKNNILELYENTFDHASFTGRSGTFFGYEGLGSIYWHMVSKLLLAVQECLFEAVETGSSPEITGRLTDHYYEIKAGIGLNKSPGLYGAFPFDAYSHTPGGSGVKQPGLTGQVKEDIISRFGELGLRLKEGRIHFDPSILNKKEFLKEPAVFHYYSLEGKAAEISLNKNMLAFTFGQVPVVYSAAKKEEILVRLKNGETETATDRSLPRSVSEMIFQRNSELEKIEVTFDLL